MSSTGYVVLLASTSLVLVGEQWGAIQIELYVKVVGSVRIALNLYLENSTVYCVPLYHYTQWVGGRGSELLE